MKDYRLSEVKEICKRQYGNCYGCPLRNGNHLLLCRFARSPESWNFDIEPRDMIELPSKERFVYKHDDGHITKNWRVFYRGEFALIETAFFPTEQEANAFLADLKGEKK